MDRVKEFSWRKSSRCTNESNCVELARLHPETLGVRDTKRGIKGPVLAFSRDEFATFLKTIKEGGLDLR
ncbi:DUF397 domain-containing protein [Spirillospora sp. CA-142024]|uniref:DUF397 domain-containing protein n=1 Tax=Spirillospora sp. CA-142024 TaxID=3240036 RepID=UPI003D93C8FC